MIYSPSDDINTNLKTITIFAVRFFLFSRNTSVLLALWNERTFHRSTKAFSVCVCGFGGWLRLRMDKTYYFKIVWFMSVCVCVCSGGGLAYLCCVGSIFKGVVFWIECWLCVWEKSLLTPKSMEMNALKINIIKNRNI